MNEFIIRINGHVDYNIRNRRNSFAALLYYSHILVDYLADVEMVSQWVGNGK